MTRIHPGKFSAALLSLALIAVLLPSDSASAADPAVLNDIAGTPFYTAVTDLAAAGIVSGYGDGTFQPYRSLSRAEACSLMYRAYGDENYSPYSHYNFSDVSDDMWAAGYIDYCAGAGIVSGYPDGTFRPDAQVTYNEIICMAVRARNLNNGQTLSWPDGWISAARADGMLDGLNADPLENGGTNPASRGDTAILIHSGSTYNTAAATGPTEDYLTDTACDCVAYGLITGTDNGTDSLGNACTIGRLLMGTRTYDIIPAADTPELLSSYTTSSGLVRLVISEGRVASIQRVTSASDGSFGLLTPASSNSRITQFCRVTAISDRLISYTAASEGTVEASENAVCYRLYVNGGNVSAAAVSTGDIGAGDMICAYTVTGTDAADIILTVKSTDIGRILYSAGNNNIRNLG